MQDLLLEAHQEMEQGGAISEQVFEDYMVRALEITHDVQAVLDRQQRQLVREMDAIREQESFFAAHIEQGPQQVEAS